MKHLLSVQDLSCVGRCSLGVALPVVSAMGLHCSALPTAVLSTHTGFPDPEMISLTDAILPFANHWRGQNLHFDGILVGYLADPTQMDAVENLIHRLDAPVILDPAMADQGKLYRRLGEPHVAAMEKLCHRARILLPNVTEAALLTGLPYTPCPDDAWLREAGYRLLAPGPEAVVITGVSRQGDTQGVWGISREGGEFRHENPRIPRSFPGTGDLFAGVFAGGILRGMAPEPAATLAADFVARCVSRTQGAPSHGVDFEEELPWLWQRMGKIAAKIPPTP